MSLTEDLHKGMVIRHEGQLFTVLDFSVAQTGKQRPTVHVKLRSLKGGHTGERTLDQLGRIEEVPSETRPMQYLYTSRTGTRTASRPRTASTSGKSIRPNGS